MEIPKIINDESLYTGHGNVGDKCKGCIYYFSTSGTCDYLIMTGKRRPCPAGKGCSVKVVKKKRGTQNG